MIQLCDVHTDTNTPIVDYMIYCYSHTHTQTRPSHLVPSWLFVQVCKDASTRASAALVSAGTASSLLAAKKARSFVISS